MPRAFDNHIRDLLQTGGHYDTLKLTLSDGTTKQIAHAPLGAHLGGDWLAHFGTVERTGRNATDSAACAIGSTAFNLDAEVDRVSVKIQNVDEVIGADVVSAARRLAYARAVTGKFLFNPDNPGDCEHRTIFSGVVSAASTDERAATVKIVSDRAAAGRSIAIKTLSPRNGWTLTDTSLPTPPTGDGGGSGDTDGNTGGGNGSGGGSGGGTCFTSESRIWTTNGQVPIQELIESFERGRAWRVFCFDPVTRRVRQTDVLQVFRHFVPRSRILEYKFHHADLRVTAEHNIETALGKRRAGELTAESRVFRGDGVSERGGLRESGVFGFAWTGGDDLVEVFNFEAAIWHTYFANNTAVYNSKSPLDYNNY